MSALRFNKRKAYYVVSLTMLKNAQRSLDECSYERTDE